jgi:glycosyltransferase involved in cell wall biosynthesis
MNLSILICVHSPNVGYDTLLRRALNSLAAQTFQDFQTVIVLDECWDGTMQVVSEFQDILDIDCLERSNKQGLAKAKNAGIKLCTGDWIGFLDADDVYFINNKLERQIEFITKNPDYDIVACQALDIYYAGTEQEVVQDNCFSIGQYETDEQIRARLFNENVLCHGSVLIRKALLENMGGYPEGQFAKGQEDWTLWKALAVRGAKFYNMPFRGYGYSMGTSVAR